MIGPALALLFGLAWIPLFVYRAEAMQEAIPYYTPRERRWVRLSPMVIGLHVSLACTLVGLSSPPAWRAALGAALVALALAFWFWARAQIGPMTVTRLPDEPPKRLRRDGPFGVVRNPLYFSYLMTAAAPVIVAAQPILLLSLTACFAALVIRSSQEEARLGRQLGGEYAAYQRDVKRLIPFVW